MVVVMVAVPASFASLCVLNPVEYFFNSFLGDVFVHTLIFAAWGLEGKKHLGAYSHLNSSEKITPQLGFDPDRFCMPFRLR